MSHRKLEFPPPVIPAYNDTNARILRRILVAMLKRPDEELDLLVADSTDLTMWYSIAELAFNPLSARAQSCLNGKGGNRWFAGWLVVGHPEAEVLIDELEREGLKLGVQVGYEFDWLETWLRRVEDTQAYEANIGMAWAWGVFLVSLIVFMADLSMTVRQCSGLWVWEL